MLDKSLLPEGIKISDNDFADTPPGVLNLLLLIIEENACLKRRVEELEAKLKLNSSNSNKPPSSDSPFDKPKSRPERKKKGRKGRKGHQQKLLSPTEIRDIHPERCSCGCTEFEEKKPYYTHQHIELPEIIMTVIHFVLYQGQCKSCGKTIKGYTPQQYQTGYGPRLSALIAETGGIAGNSRDTIQAFCSSVLGFHISLGAIQKVIDRASLAIVSHYEAIRDAARGAEINHCDETSWNNGGALNWLWVMANSAVAFFMIHTNRSKEAFEELIGNWMGILVSDNYAVYRKWVGLRQTCLAHLIRKAKGLEARADKELSACGSWVRKELQRLCKWGKDPPDEDQWRMFYARFCHLIALYRDSESEAGKLVRRLEKEMDTLWVFLDEEGVEPTNNFAERIIRFAVLWRRRSQGTNSDKGNRWVERILSLRQTCRLQNKSTFAVLTDAMTCHFKKQEPDLIWIKEATN